MAPYPPIGCCCCRRSSLISYIYIYIIISCCCCCGYSWADKDGSYARLLCRWAYYSRYRLMLKSHWSRVVYAYKETQGRSIKLCAEDICHRHLIIVADLLHIGTPRPYARPQRRRCTVYTTREQYRGSRNGIPRMCVGGATAHTSDSRKVCCQLSR